MQWLQIRFFVPTRAMIKSKAPLHGDGTYTVTVEEWEELTEEERALLVPYAAVQGGPRLLVEDLGTGDPLLSDLVAAAKKEQEKKKAEKLDALNKELAEAHKLMRQPPETLICLRWDNTSYEPIYQLRDGGFSPELYELLPGMLDEKEAAEELAEAKTKELREAIAATREEERKEQERKEQEKRVLFTAQDLELRAFCVEHVPHLARAAREAYEIREATVDHIAICVLSRFKDDSEDGSVVLKEGTEEFTRATWEEREAPFTSTLEFRAEVAAYLERLEKPSCVQVSATRVMHYRACKDAEPQTAVIVWVELEGSVDRAVVLIAEE